jgi:hypothetical protein
MNKLSLFLALTVNVCIPVLEQVGWVGWVVIAEQHLLFLLSH